MKYLRVRGVVGSLRFIVVYVIVVLVLIGEQRAQGSCARCRFRAIYVFAFSVKPSLGKDYALLVYKSAF